MNEILTFIGVIINVWVFIYSCAEISDNKINYKDKWFWFALIFISIFTYFAMKDLNEFVKIIFSYLFLTTFNMKIFKLTIQKAFIISFLVYCLMIVSEMLCAFFLSSIIGVNTQIIEKAYFGSLNTSIFISIIQCFFLSFDLIKNFLSKIYFSLGYSYRKTSIYFLILSIFSFIGFTYCLYFNIPDYLMVLLTLCMIIIYAILTFNLFKEQANYYKLNDIYIETLNNLQQYEKMYERERVQTHENRNDLLIIRGLIKEGKAIPYIDKLLKIDEEKENDNIDILNKIPEGGLRGLLYYKISDINNKNIKFKITIGRNFKSSSYLYMNLELKAKLCKLLGIYIDNAIDSVKDFSESEVLIYINEVNDTLIIKIINNYHMTINFEKIYNTNYTSKGLGRGYGLSIAKSIIENEPLINNKIYINGKNFVQSIRITLSK